MGVTRRTFLKAGAAGTGAAALTALGFAPRVASADTFGFELDRYRETRNSCPYCSVGCGLIIYSTRDSNENRVRVVHVEGDPDHPVSRGSLCPKGAALLDFVESPDRLKFPEYRGPGEAAFRRVSWDFALSRLARLMKDGRDRDFVAKNAAGLTVNRWPTVGFLAASASSNETGYLTHKVLRSMGMTAIDNQARL